MSCDDLTCHAKGVDTALAFAPVLATTNTNGSCAVLNLVRPGTSSFERIGRKIYPLSLELHVLFETILSVQAGGNLQGQTIRTVVVWDKNPNGVLPTWDAVFAYTTQDGTESSSVKAPPRYDNMDRFVVLYDDVCEANPYAVSSTTPANMRLYNQIDCELDLTNDDLETVFSAQSSPATIADIASGGLYVYFRALANASFISSEVRTPSVARLWYTD